MKFDLCDADFYANPVENYGWLRENAPAYWDETNGLWGISRYDDIVEIEKQKSIFVNSGQESGYRPNIPADPSIIGIDDPQHTVRRVLVSRRFTLRAVQEWEPHIRGAVTKLLDDALATGEPVEAISTLAAPLPAMMIGHLLGFPDELWPSLADWSQRTIALGGGPRYFDQDGIEAAFEFAGACAELYEERKKNPATDVMSQWVQAEQDGLRDGEPFGVDQIISDCLLLLDGGAETTRSVIGWTLVELARRPDQWQRLVDGSDLDVAIEEFVRWVTPVYNMCRTATEPFQIGDATIEPDQSVMLLYTSANRDPNYFSDPHTFDVTRDPNPHLSFGFGTHFCLGASLARLELKIFFEELVSRVSELTLASEPVGLPTAFVNGIRSATFNLVPR